MSKPNAFERSISSFGISLQLSRSTVTKASDIFKEAENASLTKGKRPEASVAAALYIAGILENEPRTLAEVGKATGVSVNTVQRYKTQLVRELSIRKH